MKGALAVVGRFAAAPIGTVNAAGRKNLDGNRILATPIPVQMNVLTNYYTTRTLIALALLAISNENHTRTAASAFFAVVRTGSFEGCLCRFLRHRCGV